MTSGGVYRIGLAASDIDETLLDKSGLNYTKVIPAEAFSSAVKSVVGKPYKRGASVLNDAPDAFDCSALVAWAAVCAGYAIPRISIDQYVFTERVAQEDLLPGDLIFSNSGQIIHNDGHYYSKVLGKEVREEAIRTETLEYKPGTKVPGGVDHVGVYIGNGKVIHASYGAGCVIEEELITSRSFKNMVGFGRLFSNNEPRYVVEVPSDRPDLRNPQKLLSELKKFDSNPTLWHK